MTHPLPIAATLKRLALGRMRKRITLTSVIPAKAGIHWPLKVNMDPRLRGDDAAVSNRRDPGGSCSWTSASLGAVLAPHVALAADDAVFLVLHFPPRPQLRLLQRAGNQVALRFFAAAALEVLVLRDGLDALCDDAQSQTVRQGDDRLDDCLVILVLLQAMDKTLVDLDRLDRQARK